MVIMINVTIIDTSSEVMNFEKTETIWVERRY